MSEIASLINSQHWYNFAQAVYNIYPQHAKEFTDIFLFTEEPKIRYIVSTRGTASDLSLIVLLDELIMSGYKNAELGAAISTLIKSSLESEETISHFIKHAPNETILSFMDDRKIVKEYHKELIAKKSSAINNALGKLIKPGDEIFNGLETIKDQSLLEGLLQNPEISEETLFNILNKFRFDLPSLRAAARNPVLPYALMIEWSKSKDPALQRTLALNTRLNVEAQEILSCSADERTLVNLASNPVLDRDVSERFLSSLYSDSVRLAMSSNSNIPSSVVHELLVSSNDLIRASTVSNQGNVIKDLIGQIAVDETEISVIKQIVLKYDIPDSLWTRLHARVIAKSGNSYFFYMKPLNLEIVKFIRSYKSEDYKYLLILQPYYQVRKKYVPGEDLITSVSRLIKCHIVNNTLSDAFVLDEVKSLITSRQ